MLQNESLFSLVDAVEKATGRRPHLSTVLRWCTKPKMGIRLESVVLGGRRLTSPIAVLRYMSAVTEAKDGPSSFATATPRQATLAAERSAKKLRERLAKN